VERLPPMRCRDIVREPRPAPAGAAAQLELSPPIKTAREGPTRSPTLGWLDSALRSREESRHEILLGVAALMGLRSHSFERKNSTFIIARERSVDGTGSQPSSLDRRRGARRNTSSLAREGTAKAESMQPG